ncbi:MAG TPA: ABC transporter permease [Candidatus Paceibacterota bacterium]
MADKTKNILLGALPFIAVIIIWQLLATGSNFFTMLFPPPSEVFPKFWELLINGVLPRLFIISLLNIFPAFVFASLIAVILGTLIGINETVRKMFSPIISAVYLIPSLAWLPLLILIFGFTRETIWAMVAISSFTKIIYSVIGGVRSIDQVWWLTAKNFKLSTFKTVMMVVLPGSLPNILSGLRTGFGSAWRSLVGAEMLVVTAGGLGKYIWLSQWVFKFDQVIAGIIIIALVGIAAEFLIFEKIEKLTTVKWGMRQIN